MAILKSLFYSSKLHLPKGKLDIRSNVSFYCHKSAKIEFGEKGKLILNAEWFKGGSKRYRTIFYMGENAHLICDSEFSLYQGASIYIGDGATLVLKGSKGFINTNSTINCFSYIEIGDDCGLGDCITIADSDSHSIGGKNPVAPIVIGNHVWIARNAVITKGVKIGDESVVAAGAVVINDVPSHCLIGGVPAKILRENINWK